MQRNMYKISSSLTPFCKFGVPIFIAGITIPFLLDPFHEFEPLFIFLLSLVLWPFWYCFMARAQTVFEDDRGLILKNKRGTERINYDEIQKVYESGFNNVKVIVVYMRSGREFYFRPSEMSSFSESPVVARLRSKIN